MNTNIYLILFLLLFSKLGYSQLSWQGGTPPEQNASGILLFNATGTPLAGSSGTLYAHTGVTLNGSNWQNVIGNWGNNSTQPAFTQIGVNQYQLQITPSVMAYYGVNSGSITQINMVVRNAVGNLQTADLFIDIGAFQLNLMTPLENSTTLFSTGSLPVQANNTSGAANYTLTDPVGNVLNTATTTTFNFNISTPVNGTYTLSAVLNGTTIEKKFNVVLTQTPAQIAMPPNVRDGVNYDTSDWTQATLVLNAPGKEFIYVAGNFNNWNPTATHVMNQDPTTGKFWITITGLTPNNWYAFQYWVCDNTTFPNSPKVVKTADPFSTLVLSSFDDPEIGSLGVFPGLPSFQTIAPNQEREVSVIQTGESAYWQYNWTSTAKPNTNINKKDLMIYEVLIRDFDANRTYQDLINKIDYFKNLNINAIQLMPVMEFEGNMSWGYNPIYHLALDKRYGSPAKFKEFIDLCHQNNIAVILDIALNHVFGRSPLERMWMIDTDYDGWSNAISPENPYCNTEPRHTLNVGADLNHFREPENLTNTYVLRTLETWINDYRIDGLRWDLTQGFTNSCSANDGNCTGSNQPDRIGKLQWYADKQWELDPNFYVIFEHWVFGEIPIYTNYRLNEGKGIICWRRQDNEYANLLKGNFANINGVTDASNYRIQGNMESHDEERIVYKAITEGGQTFGNLSKALSRMPAIGSVFFLVPGPKMIWHFSELGNDMSINTCSNGTVGNCRLDTKPQWQWTQNWLDQANRNKIYTDWSIMMDLRTSENVFKNGQHSFNLSTTGRPRLDVWTSTQPTNELSYVMVHTNFTNNSVNFPAFFPYTGTWYNLLDNTPLIVNSTTQNITLPADGGYVVYGNKPNQTLSTNNIDLTSSNELLELNFKNPSQEIVDVFYRTNELNSKLSLISIYGRILKTINLSNTEGKEQLLLDVPNGIYLLELKTTNERLVKKMIVNNY